MSANELIPTLALVTLGIVLLAAVWQAMAFFRKRRNRDADREVDMGRRPVVDDGTGTVDRGTRL